MKHSPLPYFILAVIVAGITFLTVVPIQITTSEVFFAGGGAVSLHPNIGIYQQGWDLLNGNLAESAMVSALPAFGVEIFAFVFIIAFEIVHDAIKKGNPTIARWFRMFTYGVVIFNILTDFLYAPQSTLAGRIGFALVLSAFLFAGAWIVIALIEHAIHVAHGPTTSSGATVKP